MSTPQRTRKSPGERAAEIRAAAVALAREQGLAALTLRSVAERAGVAPALVAHYRPSMDALVAEVFGEVVGAELAEVRTAVTGTPGQRLARLFATILGEGRDDVTLVWLEAWAHGRRNPALSAAIDEQMGAWQAYVAEIIVDGCRSGDFTIPTPAQPAAGASGGASGRVGPDSPDAVAWELLAMIDGLAAHAMARGTDPAPFIARLARASEVLVGAEPGTVTAA
jgi:AcrR family transcriptional regulator